MIELVKKNILYAIIMLVVCFIFKNEISIGYATGANVVEVIDFLNGIYYL